MIVRGCLFCRWTAYNDESKSRKCCKCGQDTVLAGEVRQVRRDGDKVEVEAVLVPPEVEADGDE